ncbi:MAG TPA: class I SAM-dependent methyltransferase [Pyrinomonadaceae bacterium]|jgi:ubiquinone/menaquinone biosynthesis C-methylase UbiE|nr:class I SAM-dependent methyltransferase [Pyrinomonadaceae bacterium]
MTGSDDKYVPALNFDWLTPLYDPVVRWLMPESKFKGHLIRRASIGERHRVLDVGCGTATLTLMVKAARPGAAVEGLDGDPKILEIARRKAEAAGAGIRFSEGMAYAMPYADGSFDRVLSSMMLHHLTESNKRRTLSEVFRVLAPDGEFHVADFRRANGSLAALMSEAGFGGVGEHARYRTLFGTLSLWEARRTR